MMNSGCFGNNKIRSAVDLIIRRDIVIEKLKCFLRNEEGLTIVEYAVAAGLITAAVALSFQTLGATVDGVIVAVTGFI
jgi:pilus assembly protein Flp/PilA